MIIPLDYMSRYRTAVDPLVLATTNYNTNNYDYDYESWEVFVMNRAYCLLLFRSYNGDGVWI